MFLFTIRVILGRYIRLYSANKYNLDSDRPRRWRAWIVQSYSSLFLEPTRVCNIPNGISIGSAVFTQLTVVTNTQAR